MTPGGGIITLKCDIVRPEGKSYWLFFWWIKTCKMQNKNKIKHGRGPCLKKTYKIICRGPLGPCEQWPRSAALTFILYSQELIKLPG